MRDFLPPFASSLYDSAGAPFAILPVRVGGFPACYAKNSPMSNIEITLPDGSKQSVEAGTRPIDIAKNISPRLAEAAIVAKVNDELFDLTRPIDRDASLEILTAKNPESLYVYRHS